MIIELGDKVRFINHEITQEKGVALQEGTCYGYTTPLVTNVDYIGNLESDYVISVMLNDTEELIWTTQDLVEFIDHGEGQVMEIGNVRATRRADGSWKEEIIKTNNEKQSWLKRLFRV